MTENEYEVFWLTSVCFRTFLLRPKRATSMADVARDAHVVVGFSAWRRRKRRLRAFWRHEQQAVRMAVVAATHHSCDKSMAHACTQTDDEVPAATCAATAPTPVYEYMAPPRIVTDLESVLEPPVPVVHTAPAPVIEYVAPAPDVSLATPAPVIEYAAPAHTVTCTSPSSVTEDVATVLSSFCAAPAPVLEYVAPATPVTVNAYVAPAPVIDYIAPSPAVSFPSFFPSFSLPNEVIPDSVNPHISITGASCRSGNSRSSGYGADTGTNCSSH